MPAVAGEVIGRLVPGVVADRTLKQDRPPRYQDALKAELAELRSQRGRAARRDGGTEGRNRGAEGQAAGARGAARRLRPKREGEGVRDQDDIGLETLAAVPARGHKHCGSAPTGKSAYNAATTNGGQNDIPGCPQPVHARYRPTAAGDGAPT